MRRPLHQYAGPADYQPLIGTASTELFGLPRRTIDFGDTVHVR